MNRKMMAALVGCAMTAAHAEVETKFDRFKNRTQLFAPPTQQMVKSTLGGALVVQAFTFFEGTSPAAPPVSVGVNFRTFSSGSWRYLKCHQVAALVDGKPFDLVTAPRHTGDVLRGGVSESILLLVPWEAFARLASASTVEFRVCSTELSVSPQLLADWREIVKAGTPAGEQKQ